MEEYVFLFLDFDGVLRPSRESGANDAGPSAQLSWLPILVEILQPYVEVKIIISSDLRCSLNDGELVAMLGKLGDRFYGIVENYDELSRAEEIRAEVQRRGLTRWLAIDDHASVAEASNVEPSFIYVESSSGISSPSAQDRIRMQLLQLVHPSRAQ